MFENLQSPRVTRNLIAVNVMVFLATLVNREAMMNSFALFFPMSHSFHWWQVVTHMFMHDGIWHIFFNMYALYIFGSVVEQVIGSRKFLIFYFVCGLGAAALHLLVEYLTLSPIPTVGASGAIYGVLIAYASLFPDSKLTLIFPPISLSAKSWVLIFAAIELFTGVMGTSDGVAHFAHLGGMLIGWLLIKFWRKQGTLFRRD